MPFTSHISMVTVCLQYVSKCDYFIVQHPLVVIISHLLSRQSLGNIWHTVPVTVHTSKQHSSRWRAATGSMIISEGKTFRSESGNVRCINLTTKRRNVCIAKIVGENEHDIGTFRLLCTNESWHVKTNE